MFRKVVQRFTNAATKPSCLGPFQRSLLQQESALPNAYESNDRNVIGLSYRENTTKVQQPETFSTQYIGASKFLFGKIQASESSGIAKLSLGGDVQFKKLGDTARLNPALCHSESQPVGFGPSQQAVKNILAKGEKSDTLNEIWGLMQNPISHSFREGEMHTNEQHIESSQEEQLQGKNELESQIKEPNDRATKPTEEKNQLGKDLNSANQALNEKGEELKSKDEELKNETQQLKAPESTNKKLKNENKGLKTKLKRSESKNKELENKIQELEAFKSENEKLKGQNQQLEELKSENESQIKGLQKELEDNKGSKASAVSAQGVKSKVNYAYASFILSGVCAVGASSATPYLVICATLAVAASVFLALGCYCLYKANTALSDVKVDQPDNQRLLEK